MQGLGEVIVFCEEPLEFSFRDDGMAELRFHSGNTVFRAVMSPHNAQVSFGRAELAVAEWQLRQRPPSAISPLKVVRVVGEEI